MSQLKGSQTEQNLKDAFAGESQANRRYLYFAQKADVEGYMIFPQFSGPPRKGKPAMRTAIWNILKNVATRQPVSRWATLQTI